MGGGGDYISSWGNNGDEILIDEDEKCGKTFFLKYLSDCQLFKKQLV